MTPAQQEALLDYLAEEKRAQTQSMRYASYLPAIRAWKLWRAQHTPFGLGEDPEHVCTRDGCRDRGRIDEIVPGARPPVFGCQVSGMIHVCEAPQGDCPYTYTDGDCVHKCVFSGRGEQRETTHSWKRFNPHDVRNRNHGVAPSTRAAMLVRPGARRGNAAAAEAAPSVPPDDKWLVDMEQLLDAIPPPEDADAPAARLPAGSRAAVLKRKTHLVPQGPKPPLAGSGGAGTTGTTGAASTPGTPATEDDVLSMSDVVGVASTPLRTPMLSPAPSVLASPAGSPLVESLRRTLGATPLGSAQAGLFGGAGAGGGSTPADAPLSVGTPIRPASVYAALEDSPRAAAALARTYNGGFMLNHPDDEAARAEAEEAALRQLAPREREYARVRKQQFRQRELLLETAHNLTEIRQDTDAILFDLLWDAHTRRKIHAKRLAEAEDRAATRVDEYVKRSHHFRLGGGGGVTSATGKRRRVVLFPSMFDMDAIYWEHVNAVPPLVVPAVDRARSRHYGTIASKLWRFISYYGADAAPARADGAPPEDDRAISYTAFVTGVLYTLKQDGLGVGAQVWIAPDGFLQRCLPPSADLDWKPRHNALIHAKREGGGRLGCTPRGGKAVAPAVAMPPPDAMSASAPADRGGAPRKRKRAKTLHAHLHGKAGERGSSRKAQIRRLKRRVHEPPGWMPTGTVCTAKKALSDHFGYGSGGRTYGRSIITLGRNYLKRHLLRFAAPEWVEPLRRVLEPEIRAHQERWGKQNAV